VRNALKNHTHVDKLDLGPDPEEAASKAAGAANGAAAAAAAAAAAPEGAAKAKGLPSLDVKKK